MAFVDTKDLDGETNLKEKIVNSDFLTNTTENFLNSSGYLQCDIPNEYIESWEGTLFSKNLKCEFTNVNIKNLLLKGSILKNTDEILGLVVHTGFNTKIMMNTKEPRIKMSNVMQTMNSILFSVFSFQILCCFLFSFAYLDFTYTNSEYLSSYLYTNKSISFEAFVIKFFTFLVAYSHLIPISLYVSMEILKLLQSQFIFYDYLIFDKISNKASIAKTSELIEELGQVEFIFSDKTGTLTQNKMELKNAWIGGVIFGDNKINEFNDENKEINKNNNIKNTKDYNNNNNINDIPSITFNKYYSEILKNFNFNFCGDDRIPKILSIPFEDWNFYNDTNENFLMKKNTKTENKINEEENKNIINTNNDNNINNHNTINFFDEENDELLDLLNIRSTLNISAVELKKNILNFYRVCTLCHSAISEIDDNGKVSYASSSPEEIAFLNTSAKIGLEFKKRSSNCIEIYNHFKKQMEIWEILLEIPFDSDRKRMTVALKEKNDKFNMVHVFIKGADELLIPLINITEATKKSMESN